MDLNPDQEAELRQSLVDDFYLKSKFYSGWQFYNKAGPAYLPFAWSNMVRSGGLLCVLDTPNRLWFNDRHTSNLPFYHWLPDDVAIDYARFSQRDNFKRDFTCSSGDEVERLARWGRGVNFHDFELWFGRFDGTISVSGMDEYNRSLEPGGSKVSEQSRDGRFYNFLRETVPNVPTPFFGEALNLVLRKP